MIDYENRTLKYCWTVFTVIAFLLSSCTSTKQGEKESLTEVKLAIFQLYASGVVIAADQSTQIDPNVNCFAEVGLKPTIIKRSKGPEIVDALVGGSAEIGTLAITPQALQALQGNKLTVFATTQTTHKDIKVVGHRSSEVISGLSLKGKRVGYVGGTFGEIFLSRYLNKYKLKRSEIVLTSAGPAQLRDLFISKSLDAIVIWEPFIQDILRDEAVKKDDIFIDVDRTLYNARMNLLARPEVLQNKKKEAEKLVKALICGEQLIHKYPEKVQLAVEKWLDRKPDTLANVFDDKTFHMELNSPALLKDLKNESEWAQASVFKGKGVIPSDFSGFVDSSIMEAVAPDRVKK